MPIAEEAAGPQFSTVTATITGKLLAPDGTSLCTALAAGSTINVVAVNNVAPYNTAAASTTVTCPANGYSMTVTQGSSYYVYGSLPFSVAAPTTLPKLRLAGPVTLTTSTIKANLRWLKGRQISGGLFLDGSPFLSGASITVYHEQPGNVRPLSEAMIAMAAGGWASPAASPNQRAMFLGDGSYFATCPAEPLGTKQIDQSQTDIFTVSASVYEFQCDYDHSLAGHSLSHRSSNLVTTADAGGIGGRNDGAYEGAGWGVQYPLAPGTPPSHVETDLYAGGLLLGFSSTTILSGLDMKNRRGACVVDGLPSCRDLGPAGTVGTVRLANGGNRVRWIYTDAESPEKIGLRITQTSYDGPAGSDFVAFQYTIKNTSAASISFYPGVFMDWDVTSLAGNYTVNTGGTAISGQLMYVRSSSAEKHLGTLITGVAALGNHFLTSVGPHNFNVAAQYDALSGNAQVPSLTSPGDAWYIHSGAQITLAPKAQKTFWVAVVGGPNQAGIVANAKAAKQLINNGSLLPVNTGAGYQLETLAGDDDLRTIGTRRWDIPSTNVRPATSGK